MSINEKLSNNLTVKTMEDGTTRGKFDKLVKKDFTSAEAFSTYTLKLSFASYEVGKALSEEEEAEEAKGKEKEKKAEEAGRHRNLAIQHLNDAFALLAAEMKASGVKEEIASAFEGKPVKKSTLRKWLAGGTFARIKTNYADASRTLNMKNIPALQRCVECYASDIINGRESLRVIQNEKVSEKVNAAKKAEEEAAKAAKEAEEEAKKAKAAEEEPKEAKKAEEPKKAK